jgi:DNA topoisomerase VI subunit B
MTAVKLQREVFSTSRLAEFASRRGLTTATGYGPDLWGAYAVKELVDNALDDCEEHGIAPCITIEIADGRIVVADNGSGLSGEVLDRICDYRNRTSAREAYVSPTRGAQGNALQTVFAMGFALSGEHGRVIVEAHETAHNIDFRINALTREPELRRSTSPSSVKTGSRVSVGWPLRACSYLVDATPRFLPLAQSFAVLNPHVSIAVDVFGETESFEASDSNWRKWRPSDPTSPRWYDEERFERLIAAYLSQGKRDRPLREFLAEFHSLTATTKRSAILEAASLSRATFGSLCSNDGLDHEAASRLLNAMQASSKPIKPAALGVIGRDHWAAHAIALGGLQQTFVYKKVLGEIDGLPWVIEVAFCLTNSDERTLIAGINFSPALRNPFQSVGARSLDGLLASQYATYDQPVIIFIHLAYPRVQFTDRGKAGAQLPSDCADALADAVLAVTKNWAKQMRAEIRDHNATLRRREALERQRERHMSIKEAAAMVLRKAYTKASGDGQLPAKARQIMYAARPGILALIKKEGFNDTYFTQQILPDYAEHHPDECAGWDVVWDARGHLREPHTNRIVPLGTIEVRGYLRTRAAPSKLNIDRSNAFPTVGPENRYKNILFVEKEGFDPLIERARLAERFDIAPMSTKGMSVVAARMLIDQLADRGVETVFVLRDLDLSGFSIGGTLGTSSRRYKFQRHVRVVHLGLRLADVEAMRLESEPVAIKADEWEKRSRTLARHGATQAEIEFLRRRRVELNAMTSPQFVAFVERKLRENGVSKLIPDKGILEKHWRFLRSQHSALESFAKIRAKCEAEASAAAVPDNLGERVAAILAEHPGFAWDEALTIVTDEEGAS